MDKETESNLAQVETLLEKRKLDWVDLALILGGIVFIYILLAYGTFRIMEWWPHERVLMYLNAFMTQLSFVFLIWVLKKMRHWEWADFGWQAVSLRTILSKVLVLYAITWAINICYALVLLKYGLNPPSTDVYSKLLGQSTWYTLILNLILAGVLAPLVEETLFRGIVFGGLQAHFGKWTAAVISAVIFSGLHLQAYGFFPRFILGIALVYLYNKYRSLYPSVALHALNNIVATLIAAGLSI
ncbi:type II CAAX endopeptidase family protein [Desulfosporosinus sp. BG]|uniref:CPBP family intramembrane glutamic endopeptidase n=1 Tax=Desulfosporosinus sp. BG TaxID=1633135 RepID=UPI00083AEEB5|nr:type II CAAX endopeptidase family protein [Desulfosporosinus sp. BG]ODA40390.1 CAAX amino terminal protease family protein [Desulfosporosinus sp. BG]